VTLSNHKTFSRIKWSTEFDQSQIAVGYIDRFVGLQEAPFSRFVDHKKDVSSESFIPWHRVAYFRKGTAIVAADDAKEAIVVDESKFDVDLFLWHRTRRIDRIFNSTDDAGVAAVRAPAMRKFSAVCNFFAKGQCQKGSKCRYVHDLRASLESDDNAVAENHSAQTKTTESTTQSVESKMSQSTTSNTSTTSTTSTAAASSSSSTSRRAGGGKERPIDPAVVFSKGLSWLLRHGAIESGLAMRPDGYARVADVLKLPQFANNTVSDVRTAVDADAKSRFSLNMIKDELYVRANQGHSMHAIVTAAELLTVIASADDFPLVMHGTYQSVWPQIATEGLKPMARTHVHCCQGLPGDKGVISGMRADSQIVVVIDLAAILRDGIECHVSQNGVIMLPAVLPKYFSHVVSKKTLQPFDERWPVAHAALESRKAKKPKSKAERVAVAQARAANAPIAVDAPGSLYDAPTQTESQGVCKFFMASECTFGSRCRSVHDQDRGRAVEAAWLAERLDFSSLKRDSRRTQPQQRHLHEDKPAAVPFDLFAVLDLEGKEEIIELPVLVMRVSDCVEVGRFHRFICPTTCQTPPPLAVSFVRAIAELDAFLAPLKEAHGSRVLFATCGDWDLKTQIPHQCRVSGIVAPAWTNRWMNVKHSYNAFTEAHITGMAAMLTQTGIPLVGQHHLGMDDVSNIAKIVAWLRFRGAPLGETGWRDAVDAPVTFRHPELVERTGKRSHGIQATDDNDE
jgi:2'-phosphotransferase